MPLSVMGARRCSSNIHNFLTVKYLQTDYLGDSESYGTCEHDCFYLGDSESHTGGSTFTGQPKQDNGSTDATPTADWDQGRHALARVTESMSGEHAR
jgi:hypothetical protein